MMTLLKYDVSQATKEGITAPPRDVMESLGFKVRHVLPQYVGDGWNIWVENYDHAMLPDGKLPSYLTEGHLFIPRDGWARKKIEGGVG